MGVSTLVILGSRPSVEEIAAALEGVVGGEAAIRRPANSDVHYVRVKGPEGLTPVMAVIPDYPGEENAHICDTPYTWCSFESSLAAHDLADAIAARFGGHVQHHDADGPWRTFNRREDGTEPDMAPERRLHLRLVKAVGREAGDALYGSLIARPERMEAISGAWDAFVGEKLDRTAPAAVAAR